MIRVTFEIVPFGEEEHAKVLHTLYVCNRGGVKSDRYGNYDVFLDVDPSKSKVQLKPHAKVDNFEVDKGSVDLTLMALASLKARKKVPKRKY